MFKVVIVTQDESVFLSNPIKKLVDGCESRQALDLKKVYLLPSSPNGRDFNLFLRAWRLISIFGFGFFAYFTLHHFRARFFQQSVGEYLGGRNISFSNKISDPNSEQFKHEIRELKPDLLISLSGNKIFRSELINMFPSGVLNLHTSDLPKYRGLMPVFWALLHEEEQLIGSVFFVDEGIDTGPIIKKFSVDIENHSLAKLINLSKDKGVDALLESLDVILDHSVKIIDTSEIEGSYFGFPTRADVKALRSKGKRLF